MFGLVSNITKTMWRRLDKNIYRRTNVEMNESMKERKKE